MTYASRVQAGAALLDAHDPDWFKKIDVDKLRMSGGCSCILGQLFGSYWRGLETLEPRLPTIYCISPSLGFHIHQIQSLRGETNAYNRLARCWRDLIQERRQTT
jgi:hypothetical protein